MAKKRTRISESEITELFESRHSRLMLERNDFFLHQIHDFVKTGDWIISQPEYQRRLVWDQVKKSRLIESLLMNVPIPNVFLFEKELHRYEVMDGQQRLHTVFDFYEDNFALKGLTVWSVLNGLKFSEFPETLQRGLDRRRMSATTLLLGSEYVKGGDIRREVFARLNTGGVALSNQELRNSYYPGRFNDLITELAGDPSFTDIWEIPRHAVYWKSKTRQPAAKLRDHPVFKRMRDCEFVLRFFAFRKTGLRGAVRKILDNCMERNQEIGEEEKTSMGEDFRKALELSHSIFGSQTFRLPTGTKEGGLSVPLYDAVMVAAHRMMDRAAELKNARRRIKVSLKETMGTEANYEVIVGKPNTANAIESRIKIISTVMRRALK